MLARHKSNLMYFTSTCLIPIARTHRSPVRIFKPKSDQVEWSKDETFQTIETGIETFRNNCTLTYVGEDGLTHWLFAVARRDEPGEFQNEDEWWRVLIE